MKAGSFRDSVAKTVRLLTRDQVEVSFRGFQPMVVTRGDKVVRMVLPEINDNAPEELIEAMQGFLDHECGHIFFTPFKRAQDALKGLPKGAAKMRGALDNIVEDIRLEKLLPRELPGTKDNLERMYEAVMDKFFGKPIQEALAAGADPQKMMGVCVVVGFRALAGQKAFQRYMDTHNLWQYLTPLTSRMPTLAQELQSMETYDDVQRIVEMILNSLSPQAKQAAEDAFENAPDMNCSGDDQGDPDQDDEKSDKDDRQEKDDPQDEGEGDEADDESDGGDAGDEEGNSSEGDEADEGDGGEGDDDSAEEGDGSKEKSGDTGGEGHGDGEGTDDGSDEEGGECSSDEDGGEDDGGGDGDGNTDDDTAGSESEDDSEGKTHRSITDALKQLDPTQRKVLYLHKNKRRSIQRIAEKMNMSEDEVKATLRDARRNLADIYMGSA